MKIIIAPDKFKDSLTSVEVCMAIQKGILRADKDVEVLVFPMADGGDGFAGVMKHYLNTSTQDVESVDPLGRLMTSSYEWNQAEKVAIIELAVCSGLAMLQPEERNPLVTSTYGTGLQIQHAIAKGAKKIILGLGGSATNDAGTGILSAMGFSFLNADNIAVKPCGEKLLYIEKIIPPPVLPAVQIEIACDVNNPLYGPQGAACIFSPQKGASPAQVKLLDEGLKHFASVIQEHTAKDVSTIPGTGAAGGIAAGLMAYLDVSLVKGIELIMNASGIERAIGNTDIIITGEGKIDQQSFSGKTVSAIASMAREKNIPCAGLCGKLELSQSELKQLGLAFAREISDGSLTEEESMARAAALLEIKAELIMPACKEISKKNI